MSDILRYRYETQGKSRRHKVPPGCHWLPADLNDQNEHYAVAVIMIAVSTHIVHLTLPYHHHLHFTNMSAMETDELPVVLPSSTVSGLSLSLHPLPILNISEHLTRLKLQKNSNSPFGMYIAMMRYRKF